MYTDIPDGTRLLGLTIKDGVATVDLSRGVRVGRRTRVDPRPARPGRLHADPVPDRRPACGSSSTASPSRCSAAQGVVLDHPVGRDDYTDQLPAIFIDRPAWGARARQPRPRGRRRQRVRGDVPGAAPRRQRRRPGRPPGHGELRHRAAGARSRSTWPYTVSKGQYGHAPRLRPVGEGRHPGERHRVPGLAHAGRLTPGGRAARQRRPIRRPIRIAPTAPGRRARSARRPSGGTAPPTGGARRTRPAPGPRPHPCEIDEDPVDEPDPALGAQPRPGPRCSATIPARWAAGSPNAAPIGVTV